MLFVPFRDEASLLNGNETAEEAFQRLLPASEDCQNYHSRLQTMLKAKANLKAIREARQTDGKEEVVVEKQNDPELPGEAKSAMNDMCEINANAKSNDLTSQERIAMLNADQKRIFDKVAHHLLHQKEHEEEKCKCDIKPLQMFISGVGGTGKSYDIPTYISREISIEHPSVGLASLAQLYTRKMVPITWRTSPLLVF